MKVPVYLKSGDLFAEVEDSDVRDCSALTFGKRIFTFLGG